MKKLFLLLIPILLLVISCEKTYVVPSTTKFFNLTSRDWSSSNGGRTYTASLDISRVNFDNEYDATLVYASFDNGIYEQVPQVYDGISYSYSITQDDIKIDIQSATGSAVITPPGAVFIKAVFIPSDEY